jgi:hypothetical protein
MTAPNTNNERAYSRARAGREMTPGRRNQIILFQNELALFRKQKWLEDEDMRRREAFEQKQLQERLAFEVQEDEEAYKMYRQFGDGLFVSI